MLIPFLLLFTTLCSGHAHDDPLLLSQGLESVRAARLELLEEIAEPHRERGLFLLGVNESVEGILCAHLTLNFGCGHSLTRDEVRQLILDLRGSLLAALELHPSVPVLFSSSPFRQLDVGLFFHDLDGGVQLSPHVGLATLRHECLTYRTYASRDNFAIARRDEESLTDARLAVSLAPVSLSHLGRLPSPPDHDSLFRLVSSDALSESLEVVHP